MEAASSHSAEATALDWTHVYREYAGYVAHSLLRLGVAHADVEDRTHDVFVAVHGQLHLYDPTRAMKPWLFAFAFRVAQNHRRRVQTRAETDTDVETVAAQTTDHDARVSVRQVLARLSHEERAALILHDMDGQSLEDIAVVLECHRTTAARLVRRAREQAQRLLNGGEHL